MRSTGRQRGRFELEVELGRFMLRGMMGLVGDEKRVFLAGKAEGRMKDR